MVVSLEVDGLTASSVEKPAGAEALARRLKEAAGDGQAVIPVGGRRALGLGDPPERFDLALDTTGLDRIIEHSVPDMVVTVEAGVSLERLNEELGRSGQYLPLDPYGAPGHTVGGAIAAALSGPLRLRYGMARDYLIGLRVALPDGRLAASGGRVVKNVSGYDMNKLHHGALGSLGVIVAASFKLFPKPLHEVTLRTEASDQASAWGEARRALALPMEPISLVLRSGPGGTELFARLAGTRAAVELMATELGWAEREDMWAKHSGLGSASWARVSVPPTRLAEHATALPEGAEYVALPGVGALHWLNATDAAAIRPVRERAEAAGGSLTLIAAAPELKRQIGAWGTPPATLEVMRSLKRSFDPGRVLSPGRFVV